MVTNRLHADEEQLSRRNAMGLAASATVLGLSGCMGILGGGGDNGGLFDRIRMLPDGAIRVWFNHDALDSDDKEAISEIVLSTSDGEELQWQRYSPYTDTVDIKPYKGGFTDSPLAYGEHTLKARDDFGDEYAEMTVDYTTAISVTNISNRGPDQEPRGDAESYSARDGNSWSQSEVEIQFENSGAAPAYISDLTFEGVQDAMPALKYSKSAPGEWSTERRNVVPNDSEATVATTFDHGERIDSGQREFPCGESYDTTLLVVVGNGHEEVEVPVTLHFQGNQYEQHVPIWEQNQYCEDFDIELR